MNEVNSHSNKICKNIKIDDLLENPVIIKDFLSIRSKWRQANSIRMKGNNLAVGPGKNHHHYNKTRPYLRMKDPHPGPSKENERQKTMNQASKPVIWSMLSSSILHNVIVSPTCSQRLWKPAKNPRTPASRTYSLCHAPLVHIMFKIVLMLSCIVVVRLVRHPRSFIHFCAHLIDCFFYVCY